MALSGSDVRQWVKMLLLVASWWHIISHLSQCTACAILSSFKSDGCAWCFLDPVGSKVRNWLMYMVSLRTFFAKYGPLPTEFATLILACTHRFLTCGHCLYFLHSSRYVLTAGSLKSDANDWCLCASLISCSTVILTADWSCSCSLSTHRAAQLGLEFPF